MSNQSRRGFLKVFGATVAAVGVGSANAQAASTALAAPYVGNGQSRTTIRDEHLEMLIVERLRELIASGRAFTAYDVTRTLRSRHAAVNVPHAAVRAVVHARMTPLVTQRFYTCAKVPFPAGNAIRYTPVAA